MLSLTLLVGCTNTQIDDSNTLDETPSENVSIISDEAIEEFEEKVKRPYLKNKTYYTQFEEVKLLDYDYINDAHGDPALVILFDYKNISDQPKVPVNIGLSLIFTQKETEITESQAELPEDFLEKYPAYTNGFNNFNNDINPGDSAQFIMSMPLENDHRVAMTVEVDQIDNSKDNVLYFEK